MRRRYSTGAGSTRGVRTIVRCGRVVAAASLILVALSMCYEREVPAHQAESNAAAVTTDEDSPLNPDRISLTRRMAEKFETDEQTVAALREKGIGWGQIEMTLAIARRAGLEADEIALRRARGDKWSEIPRQLGFELVDVIEDQKAFEVIRDEEIPISELLASYYEVDEEVLYDLKDRGMDWGEIQVSLEVARRTGSTVTSITDRYFAGEGLGDITKSFGFTPAQILKASENPFKREDEAFVKTNDPEPAEDDDP